MPSQFSFEKPVDIKLKINVAQRCRNWQNTDENLGREFFVTLTIIHKPWLHSSVVVSPDNSPEFFMEDLRRHYEVSTHLRWTFAISLLLFLFEIMSMLVEILGSHSKKSYEIPRERERRHLVFTPNFDEFFQKSNFLNKIQICFFWKGITMPSWTCPKFLLFLNFIQFGFSLQIIAILIFKKFRYKKTKPIKLHINLNSNTNSSQEV